MRLCKEICGKGQHQSDDIENGVSPRRLWNIWTFADMHREPSNAQEQWAENQRNDKSAATKGNEGILLRVEARRLCHHRMVCSEDVHVRGVAERQNSAMWAAQSA